MTVLPTLARTLACVQISSMTFPAVAVETGWERLAADVSQSGCYITIHIINISTGTFWV